MKIPPSEKRKVLQAFHPCRPSFKMIWGEGMVEEWKGSQFLDPDSSIKISLMSNWGRKISEEVGHFTGTPEQWAAALRVWVK